MMKVMMINYCSILVTIIVIIINLLIITRPSVAFLVDEVGTARVVVQGTPSPKCQTYEIVGECLISEDDCYYHCVTDLNRIHGYCTQVAGLGPPLLEEDDGDELPDDDFQIGKDDLLDEDVNLLDAEEEVAQYAAEAATLGDNKLGDDDLLDPAALYCHCCASIKPKP